MWCSIPYILFKIILPGGIISRYFISLLPYWNCEAAHFHILSPLTLWVKKINLKFLTPSKGEGRWMERKMCLFTVVLISLYLIHKTLRSNTISMLYQHNGFPKRKTLALVTRNKLSLKKKSKFPTQRKL